MRILWGALRAVSVEAMGVLAILWMLQGATGLAIDAPWRSLQPKAASGERSARAALALTRPSESESTEAESTEADVTAQNEMQRATVRQWFNTLFPAALHESALPPATEQRAEFTRDRLDYYSQHYGIASRE